MSITTKTIESLAKILNKNTRNSTEEWTDGKANEGHYKLNSAFDLGQISNFQADS